MEQPVPMALGGMGETALSRYYLHSGERDSPLVPGPPLPSAHNPGTLPAPRGGRAPPHGGRAPARQGPPAMAHSDQGSGLRTQQRRLTPWSPEEGESRQATPPVTGNCFLLN